MDVELPAGLKMEQVHRYLANRTREFANLKSHLETRDLPAIREMVHRVKGNAALYAMPELGIAAGAVVTAVDAEEWGEIEAKVFILVERLAQAKGRFAYFD